MRPERTCERLGRLATAGPRAGRATSALLVFGATFWSVVYALPPSGVQRIAWVVLFVVAAASVLVLIRRPWLQPVGWLYAGLCAAIAAASLFGANVALDAVHGSARAKPGVAAALGGLELWFVLCPGATCLSIACAVGRWRSNAARAPSPRTVRRLWPSLRR